MSVAITGGAGGMGLATARIVGRDEPVLISDVGAERLERALADLRAAGIDAEAMECDVTDAAGVRRLLAHGPRAVIHTAGVSPQMGSADTILRINALGTINVADAFLPHAREGSVLVNVASMAAWIGPGALMPSRAYPLALTDPTTLMRKLEKRCNLLPASQRPGIAYMMSKHFVVAYSKLVAPRFGAVGARVLSVSPGTFDTEMGRLEEKSGSMKLLQYAALKRAGRPEEVAELLAFCASDKAGYLTATDILVDGGTVAGMTWRDLLSMAR